MITYGIVLKTPLGKKRGKLILEKENETLSGYLDILGHKNLISNGKLINDECSFIGDIITLVRAIHYEAIGKATKNDVNLQIHTEKRTMFIIGKTLSNID